MVYLAMKKNGTVGPSPNHPANILLHTQFVNIILMRRKRNFSVGGGLYYIGTSNIVLYSRARDYTYTTR